MACDMLWSTAESQLQYPIRGMVMSASKGRWPNHCGLCGRRGLAEVVARSSSPIPHQRLLFHLIGLAMGPQLVGTFKLQCISFQNFAAWWGYLLYTIAWRLRTSRDGSMQPFMARKFWQQTTLYSSFLTIHNCFVKRSYIMLHPKSQVFRVRVFQTCWEAWMCFFCLHVLFGASMQPEGGQDGLKNQQAPQHPLMFPSGLAPVTSTFWQYNTQAPGRFHGRTIWLPRLFSKIDITQCYALFCLDTSGCWSKILCCFNQLTRWGYAHICSSLPCCLKWWSMMVHAYNIPLSYIMIITYYNL